MFEIVVMPLTELWADPEHSSEDLKETLAELQFVLTTEAGFEVTWDETVSRGPNFDADGVNVYCIYGLRAAAAWLEFNDTLDAFEMGDEPWSHEILDKLEEHGKSERFPQILHSSDTTFAAFVPVDMPDVFLMEGEDDADLDFSVGSAVGLRRELDDLRAALGLEEGLEEHLDDIVFDPAEDPLAEPRYGWLVLSARTNEALEKKLPLLIIFEVDEDEDDEDDEEDGEEGGEEADSE